MLQAGRLRHRVTEHRDERLSRLPAEHLQSPLSTSYSRGSASGRPARSPTGTSSSSIQHWPARDRSGSSSPSPVPPAARGHCRVRLMSSRTCGMARRIVVGRTGREDGDNPYNRGPLAGRPHTFNGDPRAQGWGNDRLARGRQGLGAERAREQADDRQESADGVHAQGRRGVPQREIARRMDDLPPPIAQPSSVFQAMSSPPPTPTVPRTTFSGEVVAVIGNRRHHFAVAPIDEAAERRLAFDAEDVGVPDFAVDEKSAMRGACLQRAGHFSSGMGVPKTATSITPPSNARESPSAPWGHPRPCQYASGRLATKRNSCSKPPARTSFAGVLAAVRDLNRWGRITSAPGARMKPRGNSDVQERPCHFGHGVVLDRVGGSLDPLHAAPEQPDQEVPPRATAAGRVRRSAAKAAWHRGCPEEMLWHCGTSRGIREPDGTTGGLAR